MTKILLTRHGHVEGIQPERFRGRAELALTAEGVAQAAALAGRIAAHWKPAAIYTSALQRCVVTGAAIGRACGIEPVAADGLMDIDYGRWQMRTHDEIKVEAPEAYRQWKTSPQRTRFPDGESFQDLFARTADVLRLVLARHPDETVVLVGHDSVNRALLLQLLDAPAATYWRLRQDPCTLNEIDVSGEAIQVRRINDTSHLSSG